MALPKLPYLATRAAFAVVIVSAAVPASASWTVREVQFEVPVAGFESPFVPYPEKVSNGTAFAFPTGSSTGLRTLAWDLKTGKLLQGPSTVRGVTFNAANAQQFVGRDDLDAVIYDGTSTRSLRPNNSIRSEALSTNGRYQGGYALTLHGQVAGYWQGTSESFVALTDPSPVALAAAVLAVTDTTQIGFDRFVKDNVGYTRPVLWRGSKESRLEIPLLPGVDSFSPVSADATSMVGTTWSATGQGLAAIDLASLKMYQLSIGPYEDVRVLNTAEGLHVGNGYLVEHQGVNQSLLKLRALAWNRSGELIDLNSRLAQSSLFANSSLVTSYTIGAWTEARMHNILGAAVDINSETGVSRLRYVIWSQPVPEPATIFALSGALMGLAARRRNRSGGLD